MAMLLVTGFKNYVRLQYFMFAATGILVVILVVQFLRTTPAEFAAAMNHFASVVDGREDYYQWLIKDVSGAGVDLLPAITIGAILLATPIVWTSLQWATYSVQQGGEIKGARVFKNQMFIIVGSMIAVGVVLAIIAWAEERAVGTAFFNAVSHSYYYLVSASGDGIGSVLPFPGMFAIVISPNPIITILVAVSFILASLQITCNCYIGMTRIMVGMSLDRTLPAWFSKVNPRFRSPVNAHLIYFLLGCVAIYGYNYWTQWYTMTLGVTFACGYVFTISCLAAALLPYRAKALYEASPGAKYTLGGFPLVTDLRHHRVHLRPGGPHRVPHQRRTTASRARPRTSSWPASSSSAWSATGSAAPTTRARASTSTTPSSRCRRSEPVAHGGALHRGRRGGSPGAPVLVRRPRAPGAPFACAQRACENDGTHPDSQRRPWAPPRPSPSRTRTCRRSSPRRPSRSSAARACGCGTRTAGGTWTSPPAGASPPSGTPIRSSCARWRSRARASSRTRTPG